MTPLRSRHSAINPPFSVSRSRTIPKQAELTARISEWDSRKGFGFLQVGAERVFLHRRDFKEHHKKPAEGDLIRFAMGSDARGRPCATQAVHVNDGGRITLPILGFTAALLILPVLALHQQGINLWWVAPYVLVLGVITYARYAADKRRARANDWRVSEVSLHLLELLGGWPGAFLAQRRLRHKCAKGSYQLTFWMIVLLHQFVALDALQNWELSRAALERIKNVDSTQIVAHPTRLHLEAELPPATRLRESGPARLIPNIPSSG